jgi:hypothetical protein
MSYPLALCTYPPCVVSRSSWSFARLTSTGKLARLAVQEAPRLLVGTVMLRQRA